MNSRPANDSNTTVDSSGLIPLHRFWQPRYWGLWLVVVLLRILAYLPFTWQMRIGRSVGRIAMRVMPKRRKIVRVNLRLCFAEYDDARIDALVRDHFESFGMSLLEIGLSWWISERRARKLVRVIGLEHLKKAIAAGDRIIVLSGHFPGGEICGIPIRLEIGEMAAMYRPTSNPFADQIIRRGRQRSLANLIPKDGLRQMIRFLKQGIPVWYASDQAYDRKGSAVVPFFGEPSMTNCALTNIARASNAKVIPFFPSRRADLRGYDALLLPPLEDFPTDDEVADALRIHQLLEEQIRKAPAQYYWLHRRFKNRPPPHKDPYAEI